MKVEIFSVWFTTIQCLRRSLVHRCCLASTCLRREGVKEGVLRAEGISSGLACFALTLVFSTRSPSP